MGKGFSSEYDYLSANYDRIPLASRINLSLQIVQHIFYPFLSILGVPANVLTIVIFSRLASGLSKSVRRYLVAMAAADLLVIIVDLVMRHIPIVYRKNFIFLRDVPVCNIHAVLLYAAIDCSVWFTVAFTFDRFVAICCPKLKGKYCREKTAAVSLGAVTMLSCIKNVFWYFMLTSQYLIMNNPWFCGITKEVLLSKVWTSVEFLHHLTPGIAFILILLLNAFSVKHIIVANRTHRRLCLHKGVEGRRKPELENRRKSSILLFLISGNFILLWSMSMLYFTWYRMFSLGYRSVYLHRFVREIGFMMQLMSCCTNTCIYAVSQRRFREQLKTLLSYPITRMVKFVEQSNIGRTI